MLIKDIIEKYSGLLSATSPTARLDVEIILCHILGWDRVKLMINYGQDLDSDKMSIFEDMIAKRLDQMPIAYIINKKEFMGLDFYVDERVLIPRPDTELLVEDLVESIGEMESTKQARDINVLDMCTGSGAIILSGASLWKDRAKEDSGKAKDGTVNFIGVDISKSALEVATINRKSFGLDTVKLIESDLFTNLGDYRGCLDIIVSNPPYMHSNGLINENDKKAISRHGLKCDIEDVIRVASDLVKPNGKFFMVNRPNRLVDMLAIARSYKLEAKQIRFVHSRVASAPKMVLIEYVKCAKPEIRVLSPLYVYNEDGTYTDEVKAIYSNQSVDI